MNASAFWNYSLTLYQKADVATQCLWLQDNCGCNVNILLLCCWLRSQNTKLKPNAIAELVAGISGIEKHIQQHRVNRRQAKSQPERYTKLKQQELALEKQQQALLIDAINPLVHSGTLSQDPLDAFASYYTLSAETRAQHLQPITEQI